jgi:TRAP-type C4-dicarboxylate transport system permease small subunit
MLVYKILDKAAAFAEKYVAAGLMILVFLVLMLQIVMRYIFNNPLSWTEELLRFSFVSMIYLSISYAGSQDAHIRIEFHLNKMPEWLRVGFLTLADLLWLSYNVFVIIVGIEVIQSLLKYPYISPVLRVSMAYVYIIIPLGFGLLSFRVLQNLILRIMKHRAGAKVV